MKQFILKYFNSAVLVLILAGFFYFISVNSSVTSPVLKKTIPDTTIIKNENITLHHEEEKANQINWTALFPSLSGIILFFLKLFIYDRHILLGKDKKKKVEEKSTPAHPIFLEIKELLREIAYQDFGNAGKNAIFKSMINTQYNMYISHIEQFLKNATFGSPIDLRDRCRNLILTIVSDYEQKWVMDGIPLIVIQKFREINQTRLDLLLSDIDTIAFYRFNIEKDETIFYIIISITFMLKFGLTTDSINVIKQLNGELKGITFNGQTI